MSAARAEAITPDAPAALRDAHHRLVNAHAHLRDRAVAGTAGWTDRWYAYQILRSAQAILVAEGELAAVLADLRGELDE